MEQTKIDRINELSRKSKINGLNEQEKLEQSILRKEYIESFKTNLTMTLENTYIVDEKGNKKKLEKRE